MSFKYPTILAFAVEILPVRAFVLCNTSHAALYCYGCNQP